MNNQPALIQMMNDKLDELVSAGMPFYQAKLIAAMAMIETLRQLGISKEDAVKFAEIVTK
jgi:hypothetical protein